MIISKNLSIHPIETASVNDLSYSYIKKGHGDVLFFLHGFPDMANTWDTAITELSKDFTCIAPFLRGYYPTDIPADGDYSVKSIAEDIDQIAKVLDVDTYSIVGHDWGGTVAYVMANMFPTKVKKVCTLGIPHPKFLKPSLKLLFKARHILYFMNRKKAPSNLKRDNFLYLKKLYKRWSPNWKDYETLYEQMVASFSYPKRVEAALGYYWQLSKDQKDPDLIELYHQLPEAALLTMVGEKDGAIDLKQFDKMEKSLCSNFQLLKHPTAGHFLHREEEAFFIEALQEFFKCSSNIKKNLQ